MPGEAVLIQEEDVRGRHGNVPGVDLAPLEPHLLLAVGLAGEDAEGPVLATGDDNRVVARIDTVTGSLEVANGGHNMPLVVSDDDGGATGGRKKTAKDTVNTAEKAAATPSAWTPTCEKSPV